ncbi:MAG: hypothetical protein HFE49_09990 [Clostridia bacterium]|nr:hypothetical protein [Clostridia bacterium]
MHCYHKELLDVTIKTLKEKFGEVSFIECENNYEYTFALWELPESQEKLLDAYDDVVALHPTRLYGCTFMSAVRFITSDIGQSAAMLLPLFRHKAFSTHNGLLVIRSKSYFVYTGSAKGVTLYKGSVNRARVSVGKLLFQNSITDELYNACQDGIIFCKNAKEWENTFRQVVISRKSGKEQNMNELFGYLHLLPIRRESM